ncbi:MAG TPA: sodium-dependent transporter [Candidatus Heimdallarchaeota archaeon]|nr:sodium-dependent transporter [Candidatus Heimdallarchaeota archaeon]
MKERESWTNRVGFILATLGFSAGIGNLWRFPYLTGKYGGGIFLIFYILIVFLLAIPLFTIEITLGKATQKDPVGAYKTLKPKSPWFLNGYLNVATMFLIAGYAAPIVGSIFAYIFKTAVGTFSGRSSHEIAEYYASFSANGLEVIIWTLLATAILVIILRRGLNKGVEAANNIMMPALFLIIVILVVRALTLPGASKGLTFYLKPDISKFTWEGALAAIGQAYFAIGVAMCVALVYGSYLPKESKKVISNSMIVVLSSTAIAFMAGLIIFPSVFAFGLEPSSGIGLSFITMPNVFNEMPAGTVFGTLFYILFFLAALTSFIGAFEGIGAFLRDNFNFSRNKSIMTVGIGVMILASISASSQKFFGIADFISNNIFLILGAIVMAVFVGWVWKMPNFADAAGIKSKKSLLIWTVLVKYFAPLVMLVPWLAQLGVIEKIKTFF